MKTIIYNGELWYDTNNFQAIVHQEKERQTWEKVIISEGVEIVPAYTFYNCKGLKMLIMSHTVKRIDYRAFQLCAKLVDIKWSEKLEYIGYNAFAMCNSLVSIYIPNSCRYIDRWAFGHCKSLSIFVLPKTIRLGQGIINKSKLEYDSPVRQELKSSNEIERLEQKIEYKNAVNRWLLQRHDHLPMHKICTSCSVTMETFSRCLDINGLYSLHEKDEVGLTPLQYLKTNPHIESNEWELLREYILQHLR